MQGDATAADRIARIAILIALCAALSSGCKSIQAPPVPHGAVTSQIIRDYQADLIEYDRASEKQRLKVTRTLNAICTVADTASTLIAVNVDDKNLSEANPLLPDPEDSPGWFIAVKFSVGAGMDWAARRGYQREVRLGAGMLCGVALWNLTQAWR